MRIGRKSNAHADSGRIIMEFLFVSRLGKGESRSARVAGEIPSSPSWGVIQVIAQSKIGVVAKFLAAMIHHRRRGVGSLDLGGFFVGHKSGDP